MTVTSAAFEAATECWMERRATLGTEPADERIQAMLDAAAPHMAQVAVLSKDGAAALREAAWSLRQIDGVSAIGLDRQVTADWLLRLADGRAE